MPGLTGELVVTTLVCFLHCTRGCGCIGARHSPRPLIFWGGDFLHTSGAWRRENAETRHCERSEAIHSFLLVAPWIASLRWHPPLRQRATFSLVVTRHSAR